SPDRKGEWFQLYSIGFGGIPGRPIGDGPDGHSLWPSFVNIPCEYLESYYPMRIERADGTTEMLPSKIHDVPVRPGDVLHFVTWGGGGWGDPLARDPELVAREVRRGLVTAAGARRYGAVGPDGVTDPAATDALRSPRCASSSPRPARRDHAADH